MAGRRVDRRHVLDAGVAAFGEGDDVVCLIGTGPATDMTDALVTEQDIARPLLLGVA